MHVINIIDVNVLNATLWRCMDHIHCQIFYFSGVYTLAVKIVQSPVEKNLFLLQLRNESHCRFPTYLLLKLVSVSVLVFSFRFKSSVVQVLLKEKKNTSSFSRVKILQPPVYSCKNIAMKKTNAISQ